MPAWKKSFFPFQGQLERYPIAHYSSTAHHKMRNAVPAMVQEWALFCKTNTIFNTAEGIPFLFQDLIGCFFITPELVWAIVKRPLMESLGFSTEKLIRFHFWITLYEDDHAKQRGH